jgi:Uma2 family endonuclease
VLSRSSRWYDREYKRDAYFQLGVRQVWLVDIEARSVDVWRSRTEHEAIRDVGHWSVPSTERIVEIPLDELFAGIADA